MSDYLARAQRIMQRINELASISEDASCITRTYGTPAFIEGRNKVEQWMKEAGLQTRIDNIGNIRGRLSSSNNAKTFVIASHIDTILNAGKFDGPLGVLMGLDLVEQLAVNSRESAVGSQQSAVNKSQLPFNIELIGFADEEGCRFHTTYLGSKAVAGSFDKGLLDAKDEMGYCLQEVIEQNGGNINKIADDAIPANEWLGYFEIHIEQGPVLYEKNIPVGLVTAIAGQRRAGLIFNGEAGHAGTVPMLMRKDALAAASEFILQTERLAAAREGLVATVGKLHIINAASNVVPGEVIASLDIRSANEKLLAESYTWLREKAETICANRNIDLEWSEVQQAAPVLCDAKQNELLSQSINEAGYELIEMVSGAGHDAVPISAVSPISMLFVRCFKGISHNPLENVELNDLAAAIGVADGFLNKLIRAYDLKEADN
jgi:allantoate deiminase